MAPPQPDIRIFVGCHKPSRLVQGRVYTPIHLGRALATASGPDNAGTADVAWLRRHTIGDDTGDTISAMNRSFCELTAQYWAWKNVAADYYGFCHYRRYLAFAGQDGPVATDERNNGCLVADRLDDEAIARFGLSAEFVADTVSRYDAILCRPARLERIGIRSNTEAMRRAPEWHDMRDMERALDILAHRSPHMVEPAERYMQGGENRLYNSFVMRQDLFREYCEWLFGILFELNDGLEMTHYGTKKLRTPATIAERLCGIYCLYLQEQGRRRILETPLVFFENTDPPPEVRPAFGGNTVTVVSNFDEAYVPAFSVFLGSALRRFCPSSRYDIIVVGGIGDDSRRRLGRLVEGCPQASLRFVDPQGVLVGLRLPVGSRYTRDMYHRMVIPHLLPHHARAVVVDVDTVCRADLQELHDTDLRGNLLGAVRDVVAQGYLNGGCHDFRRNVLERLRLENPYDYVNTGVLVMDLEAIRRTVSLEQVRAFMATHRSGLYEQDMLNVLFAGRIAFLDPRWNVFTLSNRSITRAIDIFAPANDVTAYRAARRDPALIHYADGPKPWHDPRVDLAEEFWMEARNSPWYESLLADMQRRQAERVYARRAPALRMLALRLSYLRYKVLSVVTWGRTRDRCEDRRCVAKREISVVRDLLRS